MKRPRKNQYWIDDPEVTWTASQVKKLSKKKQVEIVAAWFLRNFEDPAQETPYESREGGYQYISGGPYDAASEIGSEFANVLSDADIEAAVEQVQQDGIYDWAPVRKDDDIDIDDDDLIFVGHPFEQERRTEVLNRLDDLDKTIAAYVAKPPGLGHNNPPEALSVESPNGVEIHELHIHVHILKEVFSAEAPDKGVVEKTSGLFRKAIDKVADWVRKAIEKAAVSGLMLAGAHIGEKVSLLSVITEKAEAVWRVIEGWLSLVTSL